MKKKSLVGSNPVLNFPTLLEVSYHIFYNIVDTSPVQTVCYQESRLDLYLGVGVVFCIGEWVSAAEFLRVKVSLINPCAHRDRFNYRTMVSLLLIDNTVLVFSLDQVSVQRW